MGTNDLDLLVPVVDSATLRNTVAYAVRDAIDRSGAQASTPSVHFVYPISWRPIDGAVEPPEDPQEILERVAVWAREDLEGDGEDAQTDVEVVTDTIGADQYLFSPSDYATMLQEYASANGIDRVLLDPDFSPGGSAPMIPPLRAELESLGMTVEKAPVERVSRRSPFPSRSSLAKGGVVFGTTYAFYLILGGTLTTFNLFTGAIVALLSALLFAGITVEGRPDFSQTVRRIGRLLIYFPYLTWEIAKANVTVAYIILHPDLPIEPEMKRFQAAVWGDFSVTTLANSITLTPGTLTVDVERDSLIIHTLTRDATEGLEAGDLERAVRFVFWGRESMSVPTPLERDSIETVKSTTDGGASE